MNLGEFIKQMAVLLDKQGVEIPFKNETPWHELFFQLKKNVEIKGKPSFFNNLRFDWDGPYPKCRELSEFLRALHWNACFSVNNPCYETITLPNEIAELWGKKIDSLDQDEKTFLYETVEIAKKSYFSSSQ